MKILGFYAFTLAMLFGALTVLFSALGVGNSEPPPVLSLPPVPEKPDEFHKFEEIPEPQATHNHLRSEVMYKVEMPVALYSRYGINAVAAVTLPAEGIFLVENRIDAVDAVWYQVRVSDGRQEHRLYLRAVDLNWQNVEPYHAGRPTYKEILAEKGWELENLPYTGDKEKIDQMIAARKKAAQREALRREQETAMLAQRNSMNTGLRTLNSKGLLSSAILAGIVTVGMAAMLGAVAWIRYTKRWTSGSDIEALWGDDGDDYLPEEPQVRRLPNSNTHDPYA